MYYYYDAKINPGRRSSTRCIGKRSGAELGTSYVGTSSFSKLLLLLLLLLLLSSVVFLIIVPSVKGEKHKLNNREEEKTFLAKWMIKSKKNTLHSRNNKS